MKEDTICMVKGVQDTCSEMLADVVGNFNSGIALARSEFEAIMRAEREERIQDQALQHSNSEVLQGRCDHHREDIVMIMTFSRFSFSSDSLSRQT